ncbi:MAG TPA: hypothetical protein VKZ71_10895, partial [Burkholderiaceae bacterium]|nr:hypothetical protein [Burkholderiaceae bacterium]
SQDLQLFDTGSWQSYNVTTQGAVSWGEFAGGVGSISQDPLPSLAGDQYMPYVVGSVIGSLPTTGTLSYSLDGATPARAYNNDGTLMSTGVLEQFDMDIGLANFDINYSMRLVMPEDNVTGYGARHFEATNQPAVVSSTGPVFEFAGTVDGHGAATCTACTLNVDGFIAGPDASQAGIVYSIGDGGVPVTGGAVLTDGTLGN